jgi:nitrous oxidase accessory protein NosD
MAWGWTGLTGALTVPGAVRFSASPVARADAIAVDCGGGERVQPAIDRARPGDTVVVSGSCDEHVTVREEAARITLDGQGTATIHGPNPALAVLTVLGRGIAIRGFTLSGGEAGIAVWRGGTALIDGNTIPGYDRAPG